MLERIAQLSREAGEELAAATTGEKLEAFRVKYLGPKGSLKAAMAWVKEASPQDRPAVGEGLNRLKGELQAAFDAQKEKCGPGSASSGAARVGTGPGAHLDLTEPGLPPRLGRQHVLTQTIDDLIDVFGRMGFDVATGPEVEDEFHNFVALNIPEAHPARDPLDNFYIDLPGAAGGAHLLRSQTSTIQIRVMEKTRPPVRVVAMGRVYRPDEHDATHYSMFHQVEGLYVDRGVSMVDLKTTLFQFVHAYFGPEAKVRLRPSFFPFTEPSAEMDVWMNVRGTWKWVEVGGCGMVDPNVFEAVGYDPEVWSGFAFGLGIERLAMRKYGIGDIRWLFENDVRFLRQF